MWFFLPFLPVVSLECRDKPARLRFSVIVKLNQNYYKYQDGNAIYTISVIKLITLSYIFRESFNDSRTKDESWNNAARQLLGVREPSLRWHCNCFPKATEYL